MSMNKLASDRRAAVIRGLVEGGSIRAVARMTGVDKDTVLRVLVEVGEFCSIYQYHALRDLHASEFNATRFGHSAERRHATRKSLDTATCGHSRRWTPTQSSWCRGSSVSAMAQPAEGS